MSLRLILAIIGALILAAILWDGYRHWRKSEGFSLASKFKIKDFTGKFSAKNDSESTPMQPLSSDDAPDILAPIQIDDHDDSPVFNTKVNAPQETAAKSTTPPQAPANEHAVIVLHVLAKPGEHFSGDDLRIKFQSARLYFGELQLFHKHENDDIKQPVLFSLANALEPGKFDLAHLDSFTTTGLALFLQLPGEFEPQSAFKQMHQTAQSLAQRLNARLCDRHRQPLTPETLQRYTNQVALYRK